MPPSPTEVTTNPAFLVTAAIDVVPDLTSLTHFFIWTRESETERHFTSISRYIKCVCISYIASFPGLHYPTVVYTPVERVGPGNMSYITIKQHVTYHGRFPHPHSGHLFVEPFAWFSFHWPVFVSLFSFLSFFSCVPHLLFRFFQKLRLL